MTIRSLKAFRGSALRRLALVAGGLTLAVALAGCSLVPASHKKDVPAAVASAGVGVIDVEVSESQQGFTKVITVRNTFESADVTQQQFEGTLSAIAVGLGRAGGAKVLVAFAGPDGANADGVDAATTALNQRLGLSGDDALESDLSRVWFSSGKQLQSVVRLMEAGEGAQ